MICPCGVDADEYPHSSEICAPTLPERLKKMAGWIDNQSASIEFTLKFTLSQVYYHGYVGDYGTSAFPSYRGRGCVYCGNKIDPIHMIKYRGYFVDLSIRVGKYDAHLCPSCFRQGRRLCPDTMSCSDICIQRDKTVLKEFFLCIRRLTRLSLDLRRFLYGWIRKICTCQHH